MTSLLSTVRIQHFSASRKDAEMRRNLRLIFCFNAGLEMRRKFRLIIFASHFAENFRRSEKGGERRAGVRRASPRVFTESPPAR
ncbi:hypothetical protein CLOSTASPAR_05165 [[Clostridium] asparagiforme DSM 15981]|uniref:Uncharacterized protein n=1 Tax=[Clostridium] asparagiforme DSM 15981 TaxID=518636 RepID=C0D7B8_9FIRM|nr:hypothetical protein CLOSTASPAR_05165 [[Clostridium] asparagiforme DSM 15981]